MTACHLWQNKFRNFTATEDEMSGKYKKGSVCNQLYTVCVFCLVSASKIPQIA